MNTIKVAMIGLDTSHSIEFTRRMQAPDCPDGQLVPGLKVTRCLRFSTPFQNEEGLDGRQKTLEGWGVKVTQDFDEAVGDCDAVMMCINDPAFHLEYFKRCATLGKRMFVDKPLADTIANGKAMMDCARANKTEFFSASSLRFGRELLDACGKMPKPLLASTYGPLGKAPAGSSIVWYGVHAFEMLERALGKGATSVATHQTRNGACVAVHYEDDRAGTVELSTLSHVYAGCLRTKDAAAPFVVEMAGIYTAELREVAAFFQGGPSPVAWEDTLEVMALLDAAEQSAQTGRLAEVAR